MRSWKGLRLHRRALVLTGALIASLALAGGIAYATIPDSNKVFTACMLNKIGTIRLIDPSLPATNLMSHCTSLETQISWNQQGQPGPQGLQGPQGAPGPQGPAGKDGTNGTNGKDGVSVTSAAEPAGANCANAGASFTSASGTTYACNGAPGPKGDPGPQGATGATGSMGPAGPSGPVDAWTANSVGGLGTGTVSVTVPPGSYVVTADALASNLTSMEETAECTLNDAAQPKGALDQKFATIPSINTLNPTYEAVSVSAIDTTASTTTLVEKCSSADGFGNLHIQAVSATLH